MKIIVIGYGRLGSQFVKKVNTGNHEIVVIDLESTVVDQSGASKGVRFLIGNAIDEDLLREAGVDKVDVLMALTRDENTNLMIAQMARLLFNVPRVFAAVYDPQRQASFHESGIETLAIAVAGADLLAARLGGVSGEADLTLDAWLPPDRQARHVPLRPLEATDGSFYVIIVGGGLVGFYLARTLLQNGHEVTIIERNSETHALVSQQIDCPVLLGDGSTTAVLEQAGASRAQVLCAVSNHDQDNLIACQVAKAGFGVPKTIARVKNPKNESVMRRLGVDTTVSSTGIITNVIESELPMAPARTLVSLGSCGAGIVEYYLTSVSPVVGRAAREVKLPPKNSLIGVLRGGEFLTRFDSLAMQNGDIVVALVQQEKEPAVRKILLG